MQVYPPRPLLLGKALYPLVNGRAEILFQVPKGANYYVQTFTATYPITVAANVQTTDDLSFRAILMAYPFAENFVALDGFTGKGDRGLFRASLPVHEKVSARSVIKIFIAPLGIFATPPSTVSITWVGRAGWEVK